MAYDPNRDYAKEIDEAIASGASKETVAQLNAERSEKIAANRAHYDAKGISDNDRHGTAAREYVSGAGASPNGTGGDPSGELYSAGTPQAAQVTQPPATPAARNIPQSSGSTALSQQAAQTVRDNRMSHADTGTFRGYLDDWLSSAQKQSGERIDRGVTPVFRRRPGNAARHSEIRLTVTSAALLITAPCTTPCAASGEALPRNSTVPFRTPPCRTA